MKMGKPSSNWFIDFTVGWLGERGWQPTQVEWCNLRNEEMNIVRKVHTLGEIRTIAQRLRQTSPRFLHEDLIVWFEHPTHGRCNVLFVQQNYWAPADWENMPNDNEYYVAKKAAWEALGGYTGIEVVAIHN